VYLIYVDDYGNTDTRLDDPQQPLFLLTTVLVAESGWKAFHRQVYLRARQLQPEAASLAWASGTRASDRLV